MSTPLQPATQGAPTMRRAAANPVDWRRHLPARWADRVVEVGDETEALCWQQAGADILVTSAPYLAPPRDVAVTISAL